MEFEATPKRDWSVFSAPNGSIDGPSGAPMFFDSKVYTIPYQGAFNKEVVPTF